MSNGDGRGGDGSGDREGRRLGRCSDRELKAAAQRAGLTGRDVWVVKDWVRTRRKAITSGGGVRSGWCVTWPAANRTELMPIDVPSPGRLEVTVETLFSAVSPGTERAQYLTRPNARISHPFRPGYSASGRVVAVGSGVVGLEPGDLVATSGLRHQSIGTVPVGQVCKVPAGVDPRAAALVELAVIASVAHERAPLPAGAPFAVVGAGVIGTMAARLAAGRGADPVTYVARSPARSAVSAPGGRFLVADDPGVDGIGAAVVHDAVGSDASLRVALRAVAPGGTVVLLGSPRAARCVVPAACLQAKGAILVGAHVSMRARPWTEAATEYLDLVATGQIEAADLVAGEIDPRDAGLFYRHLATSSDPGTVVFDWSALPAEYAPERTRLLARPEVPAKGVTYDGAARPVPATALSGVATDPFAGASGRLRVGVVGCGEVALQNARGLVEAPNTELTACFDTDAALAADLAGRFGGRAVGDLDAVLAAGDVDAVLVSVPHHLHRPLGTAVVEAGKHLVMEKPLANSLAEAEALSRATEASGMAGSVCFANRYDHRLFVGRQLVAMGLAGEIEGFSLMFFQDKAPSYWTGGLSGRTVSDWRGSREQAGGGVLIMNACHYLDLLRHVTALDIDEVMAMSTPEPGRDIEQAVTATVRLSNGAIGTVSVSSSVRGTRYDELRVWGTDGHIEVIPTVKVFALRADRPLSAARWNEITVEPFSLRAAYFSRLATALDLTGAPEVTIADGLAVQAAVEAIYTSAATGLPVRPGDLLTA